MFDQLAKKLRRIVTRYEHHSYLFHGFVKLACLVNHPKAVFLKRPPLSDLVVEFLLRGAGDNSSSAWYGFLMLGKMPEISGNGLRSDLCTPM